MPAPRPSITAITAAKDGSPSGVARAAIRIWPTMTPISAPISVAAIAASERKRTVSRMIAMPTPISSPTGASCSEARSIRTPRALTSTARLGRLGRFEQRLAVRLLEVPGLPFVADVDGGERPSSDTTPPSANGSADLDDAVEALDLLERSPRSPPGARRR